MRTLLRTLPALALLLVIGAATAACGRTTSAGGPTGGFTDAPAAQTVEVRVDPSGRLAWERPAYEVAAGDVTFVVSSPAGLAHNFVIEGQGMQARSETFAGGTTNRYSLQGLQPGTYRSICTVPGHHEGGMTATLHVW